MGDGQPDRCASHGGVNYEKLQRFGASRLREGRASRLANVPCGIASGFICEKNIPHAPHWYRRRSMLMLLFPTVAGCGREGRPPVA